MRTVKVVMIGSSGTGKTSLRGQYISGQFSTGYRATIGTDFHAKVITLDANDLANNNDNKVNLQVWDTAGQERFSALSSAFYRGADAAILVYDVRRPQTLHNLETWWRSFVDKCPVPMGEEVDWPVAVVGNKMDLIDAGSRTADGDSEREDEVWRREEAERFVNELIDVATEEPPVPNIVEDNQHAGPSGARLRFEEAVPPGSTSITINGDSNGGLNGDATGGALGSIDMDPNATMKSSKTGNTIYHTPSSSLHEHFLPSDYLGSAASSVPDSMHTALTHSQSRSHTRSRSRSRNSRRLTLSSLSSSAPTITPSLFKRQAETQQASQENDQADEERLPLPPLERGAKLFLASAKTGEGVPDIFTYIARRTIARLERQEVLEELCRLHADDNGSIITHGNLSSSLRFPLPLEKLQGCCSS